MALAGDAFNVADTDALLCFRYDGENVSQAGEKVADLTGGPIDHHWTKNVIASEDRKEALRDRRLQQQRRRERTRQGEGPRGNP